ncbi:DUF2975 domain-containing protein [Terrisporobacter glycolicus]|uniref:DUF2975 domain-containing protein n=1 Tax=Terrisporobacter glycolicus ATCC 14880 = DSM 1288 TaxID=1121315 RepID=A0ABZ2EYV1_9FIRM|nr:DUF2975 domain-containing protein [Terrisporobacter glycolicus]
MLKNTTKTKSILSSSLIMLFFALGLILIMAVFMGIPFIFNNSKDTGTLVFYIGVFIIGLTYLTMIAFLLDIVSTSRVNIFVKSNVKKFKNIGSLLLVNLILDYILTIINGVSGLRFLDLAPGVFITPGMAIYFIAGLLCFVIADAFDQAITIKEENEYTV